MLLVALLDSDALYWEVEVELTVPKCKKIKVDNESISDSISMVKTAISSVKTCQPQQNTMSRAKVSIKTASRADAKTVNSQTLTIMLLCVSQE